VEAKGAKAKFLKRVGVYGTKRIIAVSDAILNPVIAILPWFRFRKTAKSGEDLRMSEEQKVRRKLGKLRDYQSLLYR
jgi:hypothetical protein